MERKVDNGLLERMGAEIEAVADERKRVFLPPRKIVWESTGKDNEVRNSHVLMENRIKQISFREDKPCILSNRGAYASLLLDFGTELHGGVEISVAKVEGAEKADLRIRFGESVMEAMSEIGEETNSTNDHACRDMVISVNLLSMHPIGETGFRFVRIDLLTENVSVLLHAVKAVLIYRDVPYLGSFSCDDELLNQIWNTGAYTVHLNMQQYIWDGIKRDRLVWVGDLHPEISTIQNVFGNQKVIKDTLDFIAQETPQGCWMNNMPSYSMWWIIIQHDHYMRFGDKEYLGKHLDFLKNLYEKLHSLIDEKGHDLTNGNFIDWPTKGNTQAVDAGMQALHILSTECASKIFAAFGENKLATQCNQDCEKMRQYQIACGDAKQAAALGVLAGILEAKDVNKAFLSNEPLKDMTTFMGYYILLARAKAEDYTGALDVIRQYWGAMLKLGATTFWEDFDIDWMKNAAPIDRFPEKDEVDIHGSYGRYCYRGFRHSLCHGWASGPTSWLTNYVLGVQVAEAGCQKLYIKPHLCDLKWVKGTYPTPYGVVEIEHKKLDNGEVETIVNAPEKVTIYMD